MSASSEFVRCGIKEEIAALITADTLAELKCIQILKAAGFTGIHFTVSMKHIIF